MPVNGRDLGDAKTSSKTMSAALCGAMAVPPVLFARPRACREAHAKGVGNNSGALSAKQKGPSDGSFLGLMSQSFLTVEIL
jgi:hypothetical protein